jgi:hypothetical protein
MAKRGIRVMLWVSIVLSSAISAYFFWVDESAIRRDTTAARTFDDAANAARRALMDLRAAQQAYVATGQGNEFWGAKVSSSMSAVRQALSAMRGARSEGAQNAIQNASSTVDDFEQMDRRAREYVQSGQLLMASDVIFSGGLELTEAAWSDIQRARAAEQQAVDAVVRGLQRRQWMALGAGAGLATLLALLLVPVPRAKVDAADRQEPASPEPEITSQEDLDLRTGIDRMFSPTPALGPTSAGRPSQHRIPDVDLPGVAALCADLARVTDPRALTPLLERASSLLDAAGLIVWIADPDGRELAPIVSHGYPPQLVLRLGTIARDAENVTAAAFRTALLQTVKADSVANGAVAAPLVTPAGCVGVMAAEVKNGGEQREASLAAATIVAAQLATLVGPPTVRKAEAAGS